MKAIRVHATGGPEVLRLEEVPVPVPGAGQIVIRVEAAGVNFVDVYHRTGLYPVALPFTLGREAAGVVERVGEGVGTCRPGDRVASESLIGGYAEYALAAAERVVPLPREVSSRVGAAVILQGLTAHFLATSTYPLRPDDTCLVHAAAGGVGQLLVQCAKLRGATVIATVGSAEKAEIARARGADHVILYREKDFREEVMRLTGGRGVDVVYDAIGKDTIARSIRSLRRRGLCINYGGASGLVRSIEPLELGEAGSVFFTRPHLADYIASPEELAWRAGDLFAAWREGKLVVTVDREFPLAEAGAAHRYLEGRKTKGKLLLRV